MVEKDMLQVYKIVNGFNKTNRVSLLIISNLTKELSDPSRNYQTASETQ